MKSKVLLFGLLAVVLAVIALSAGLELVLAHGAAPEWAEVWTGEARLFVADNARSEIVAVDLPHGQVTARIGVPPKTMVLALAQRSPSFANAGGRQGNKHLPLADANVVLADPDDVALTAPKNRPAQQIQVGIRGCAVDQPLQCGREISRGWWHFVPPYLCRIVVPFHPPLIVDSQPGGAVNLDVVLALLHHVPVAGDDDTPTHAPADGHRARALGNDLPDGRVLQRLLHLISAPSWRYHEMPVSRTASSNESARPTSHRYANSASPSAMRISTTIFS